MIEHTVELSEITLLDDMGAPVALLNGEARAAVYSNGDYWILEIAVVDMKGGRRVIHPTVLGVDRYIREALRKGAVDALDQLALEMYDA